MDKRRNNKKNNKNKHNNKTQFEQPQHAALSQKTRSALKDLVILLAQTIYSGPKNEWEQYVKIQEIIQRINVLEAPLKRKTATNKSNRLAHIDKFYQWAKDNGVQCENIQIERFPEYDLGLVATHDIKKDEVIFSIPRKLILSEEHLKCDLARENFKFSNIRLAYTLMVESVKPDSFWKPYIDLLPESYNTVLYYTVEEMLQLKGSNAFSAALKQCLIIARLYTTIYFWPLKDFKEIFNYDLFRWAVSTVMTRENLIPRADQADTPSTIAALIPFWDMANHRHGTISSFFNVETQHMESRAQDDFRKGEQIFIHYGDRSNAELMIHNGFINPQNPKDSVAIKLGLSSVDPLFEKRGKLLHLLNIPIQGELKVLPPPEHISSELLAFVRVFNMNDEQLEHWINSERAVDLLHIDCALETELETKTWKYLETRLMLLLHVFPTTIDADEKLLDTFKELGVNSGKSSISIMIIEYRLLEKRILEAALDYAKQRTKA